MQSLLDTDTRICYPGIIEILVLYRNVNYFPATFG